MSRRFDWEGFWFWTRILLGTAAIVTVIVLITAHVSESDRKEKEIHCEAIAPYQRTHYVDLRDGTLCVTPDGRIVGEF